MINPLFNQRLSGIDDLPPRLKKYAWEYDVIIPRSCWILSDEEIERQCRLAIMQRARGNYGSDHPQAKLHSISLADLDLE